MREEDSVAVTVERVWEAAVRALAFVRVLPEDEVTAEALRCGGDLVIKSKDAEVVISLVEEEFGGDPLVDVSQLGRRELTSLRTLTDLLVRRWRELHGAAA